MRAWLGSSDGRIPCCSAACSSLAAAIVLHGLGVRGVDVALALPMSSRCAALRDDHVGGRSLHGRLRDPLIQRDLQSVRQLLGLGRDGRIGDAAVVISDGSTRLIGPASGNRRNHHRTCKATRPGAGKLQRSSLVLSDRCGPGRVHCHELLDPCHQVLADQWLPRL